MIVVIILKGRKVEMSKARGLSDKFILFYRGLKRRNAVMLDSVGCPLWLIKLWCPFPRDWGFQLQTLTERLTRDK